MVDLAVETKFGIRPPGLQRVAGLTDEALDMIELYLSEPSGYGSVRTELEPAFRGLRDEPRFQELVERFRTKKLQELFL